MWGEGLVKASDTREPWRNEVLSAVSGFRAYCLFYKLRFNIVPMVPYDSSQIIIEPLRDDADARACGALMARSEPWLTLRRDFDHALALLSDQSNEVYLARAGKTLVGHIVGNMQGPFAGYIQVLAVAEEWRGRGIGERLLRFAEERIFRDSPNVFLCVSSFNPAAQRFYARLGYERVGELKDYVIPGASEFLMRKTIGPKNGHRSAPVPGAAM